MFRTIAGAGHAVMQESPWEYDRYSIEFLSDLGLWTPETRNYQLEWR